MSDTTYGHMLIFRDEIDATAAAGVIDNDEQFLDDVLFNSVNVDENDEGDYILSFETDYELTSNEQFYITDHFEQMSFSFNNIMKPAQGFRLFGI